MTYIFGSLVFIYLVVQFRSNVPVSKLNSSVLDSALGPSAILFQKISFILYCMEDKDIKNNGHSNQTKMIKTYIFFVDELVARTFTSV